MVDEVVVPRDVLERGCCSSVTRLGQRVGVQLGLGLGLGSRLGLG